MNANGTVKASQRIGNGMGGGPTLANGDYFGHSVAAIGDLDGDGVTDLAVGASKDDTGGYINGAVYVLFMNTNGTVQEQPEDCHRRRRRAGTRDQRSLRRCACRRSAIWMATVSPIWPWVQPATTRAATTAVPCTCCS